MEDPSGEFSDGLDEFEESIDERKRPPIKNQTAYKDKPYDEAFEVSQELSMAESYDGRDKVCALTDAKLAMLRIYLLLFIVESKSSERKNSQKSYV